MAITVLALVKKPHHVTMGKLPQHFTMTDTLLLEKAHDMFLEKKR